MKAPERKVIQRTIRRFLAWAHGTGWRYCMAPYYLAHFAGFLEQRGVVDLADVDADLLLAYQQDLAATRSPSTVNAYTCTLRALWRFLLREEIVTEDVTSAVRSLPRDHVVPHLFTRVELFRIDKEACALIDRARNRVERFSRHMRRTAFALLRDCGLRVSEACGLNLDNYNPAVRSLRIERTKFFKTRVIPIPRTTCARLDKYLEHRRSLAANDNSDVFFTSFRGRRLNRVSLEVPFKELLCAIAHYQPRRRQGRTVFDSTNLHALRHSFAVRVLTRWQQDRRRDVDSLLPLLSSYMGHAHVTYTKHYLHLTPTLRRLACERFGEMVLPQLDGCTGRDDD